ncbi:MAG: COG3650 family protein [Sphingomicrobium sp.]
MLASLAACTEPSDDVRHNAQSVELEAAQPDVASNTTGRWELLASGEGTALRLAGASGIHLFCPSRSGQLVVNVAGFKPVASEERLSVGSGSEVFALVADSGGDALRGGVTGEAPVPEELATMLVGPISASYGAQRLGPLPPPEKADQTAFLLACQDKTSAPVRPKPAPPTPAACQMQDGAKLAPVRLRATGTEPFWSARIDGRCVTYSTPEDQAETRIWTHYTGGTAGGTWSGALDGRQFELRTRPAPPPGCSDGMSDNRYPHSVKLRVRGETRTGCAKPA